MTSTEVYRYAGQLGQTGVWNQITIWLQLGNIKDLSHVSESGTGWWPEEVHGGGVSTSASASKCVWISHRVCVSMLQTGTHIHQKHTTERCRSEDQQNAQVTTHTRSVEHQTIYLLVTESKCVFMQRPETNSENVYCWKPGRPAASPCDQDMWPKGKGTCLSLLPFYF